MDLTFAFLPHVRVPKNSALRLGPFELWRNDPQEWSKRTGADNTPFLTMYRNEAGDPVGDDATVLTKADRSEATFGELLDAIYCLSTAVWLRGPSASDAWVFERWHVPVPTPTDFFFRRASKFSVNFTSADVQRIYPTPYTHRIDLANTDQDALDWTALELAKNRGEAMLTAWGHFHLARFDTPYFTSPGDAIEALWSGFESLLEIDRFGAPPQPAQSPTVCGKLKRLFSKSKPTKIGKEEKLRLALRAELGDSPYWRPEMWTGLDHWTTRFYLERNHHSHGVRSEVRGAMVEPYDLSAFEIAIHVARSVLDLRWRGDNPLFAFDTRRRLNSVFLAAPLVKRITEVLDHHDRKCWHPGAPPHDVQLAEELIDQMVKDLPDLAELPAVVSRQFAGTRAIEKARQKMGLVLSSWTNDLLKQPPSQLKLTAVAAVPGEITRLVQQKKSVDEIDTRIAELLAQNDADTPDAYDADEAEPSLRLRGKIPLWHWVGAYMKLTELWRGYPLR